MIFSSPLIFSGPFLGLLLLAAAADDDHTLRVVVKDSAGAPVPKAHVTLLQYRHAKPAKQQAESPTVDSMGETDSQGVVVLKNALKSRRYRVEVRAYGFLPWDRVDFRPTRPELTITLNVGFFVLY